MPNTAHERRQSGRPRGQPKSATNRGHAASRVGGAALARYAAPDGTSREIITRRSAAKTTLVIDRETKTLGDPRLVAALWPDEPPENAALVCRLYLADPAGRYCRALKREDLLVAAAPAIELRAKPNLQGSTHLTDRSGNRYRIECVGTEDGLEEPSWTKTASGAAPDSTERATLCQVIGAMEDYSPALAITAHVVDSDPRACALERELESLRNSALVLNRRLRERLLAAVGRGEVTMSEVAMRCGHVKRDRDGNECGETNWPARRVGLMPDGCDHAPSPWIHSRVLGEIARALGLNPGEVELS